MRVFQLLIISLLAPITGVALAGDGRLELNQAAVDAAGGFPFSITAPGSYVLTGSLVVPADTDGLVLSTSGVVFDLNGFSIAGPAVCIAGDCSIGTGMAIRGFSGIAHAQDTTVRNGFVSGFGDNCVRLGSGSYVAELRVSGCGRNGISVGHGSIVAHNRVSRTGESGISLAGSIAAYAQNVVSETDLAGGDNGAISGGRAFVGNICDDGSCSAARTRRYYLTPDFQPADQTLTACAAGFHMAAVRELKETAALRYASELGFNRSDSGSGPPQAAEGWVRTGFVGEDTNSPGFANCDDWSSTLSPDGGTHVRLTPVSDNATSTTFTEWVVESSSCAYGLNRTWCIED